MNYYDILGVDTYADEERIKRAFRNRAKQLHPDVNRAARAKKDFQLVNEAYQVLSDADKRRIYDLRMARGTHGQRVYYRPGYAAGYASATSSRREANATSYWQATQRPKSSRFVKIVDQVLFLLMLLAGLTALFYGIYKAVGEHEDDVNPYLAITFGVFFTILFLVGWHIKAGSE